MKQKKYMDIPVWTEENSKGFQKGDKRVLNSKLVLLGERLCSHTVLYPEGKYQTAYFYDVWDWEEGKYLAQYKVEAIVKQLGFHYVPVLYQGEFESWEQVKAFVGTTAIGGTQGEGIVVKNMTALNSPEARFPAYLKIVGEKFRETKAVKGLVKLLDTEEIERKEKLRAALDSVVTEARVRKLVYKMVDKGTISRELGEKGLGDYFKEHWQSYL